LEPGFDPRREAEVEGPAPAVEFTAGLRHERAEVVSQTPNRVVVEIDARAAGLLVLSDTYSDDWTATLDGAAAAVLPTNGLFRGVAVPAGRSEVVFAYRPRRFLLGAALSVTSLAVTGVLWCSKAGVSKRCRARNDGT
jgi:uncharacterized membrane protein YfhO